MPRITNDIRNKKQRKTEAEAINGTNTKSNERVVPKQVDQKAAVVAESDEVVKKPRHGKRIAKAVAKKERNTQRKELFNKLAYVLFVIVVHMACYYFCDAACCCISNDMNMFIHWFYN